MFSPSNTIVVILAGGFGFRLRSINDKKQKVLMDVNGIPFLKYLLEKLNASNFKKAVLCTGYLGNQVKREFGEKYKDLRLLYSMEDSSLGTAGALRYALPYLKSEQILVMNGDSFCEVDLKDFGEFHLEKNANVSLVTKYLSNTDRFGKITLGSGDRILGFEEKKSGENKGWINAGIYLINKSLIYDIPDNKKSSLETEIFPKLIDNKIYGFKTNGRFIDIGIPQSYAKAQDFFEKNKSKRFVLLDRDGTLVVHRPYLSYPNQIELIPGAVEALREFKKMGLGVIVITNQSGIGRGFFDLRTLKKIHQRLTGLLSSEGIFLDDIYFCPHIPEDDCLCRKPKMKLIERAAKKHNFDPKLSFVIGDNKSDINLGKNIGAITILVRTGYGAEVEKEKDPNPDFAVNSLIETIPIIKECL